jgi:hypothetical protein
MIFQLVIILKKRPGDYVIYSRKPFILNWDVEIKCRLDLYKNGRFDRELETGKKHIEIAEAYDGKEKSIVYHLQAEYEDRLEKSESITINIVPESISRVPYPVIHEFKSNSDNVVHEEKFLLQWEVENATEIMLYRNGIEYKKIKIQEKNIQLSESYDEDENEVEFRLVAANETGKSESPVITIIINPGIVSERPPVINEFTTNKHAVNHLEAFMLQWEVENATKITLYRNGIEYRKIKMTEKNMHLSEPYNENENEIEYRLGAENETGLSDFIKLTVTVNPIIPPKQAPVILEFTTNKRKVKPGEAFLLQWEVENATEIILYRNGVLYKNLEIQDNKIQLSEPYDKNANKVEFRLDASNESEQRSKSLTIILFNESAFPTPTSKPIPIPKPTIPPPYPGRSRIIYIVIALIALVVIFLVIRRLNNKNNNQAEQSNIDTLANRTDSLTRDTNTSLPDTIVVVYPLTANTVTPGETLTISGKNFPLSPGRVRILFNQVPGVIINIKKDLVLVKVPLLRISRNRLVGIVARIDQQEFPVAKNIILKNPKTTPTGPVEPVPPPRQRVTLSQSNDTINFSYKPEGENLFILVNNQSNWNLQAAAITITCDSVGGGPDDIVLGREVINIGNMARQSKARFVVSNTLYNLYERNRPKKRIRLQLSFK